MLPSSTVTSVMKIFVSSNKVSICVLKFSINMSSRSPTNVAKSALNCICNFLVLNPVETGDPPLLDDPSPPSSDFTFTIVYATNTYSLLLDVTSIFKLWVPMTVIPNWSNVAFWLEELNVVANVPRIRASVGPTKLTLTAQTWSWG